MFDLNPKKAYAVIVYWLALCALWNALSSQKLKYKVTTSNNTKESFDSSNGIVKSFGTFLKDKPEVAQKALTFRAIKPEKTRKLPSAFPGNNFNSTAWNKYKSYLSPIGNQGKCGSCWAWSTSYMLSDRFSLLSLGKIKTVLSPAKMVMCTFKFDKLSQEDLERVWNDSSKRQKYEDDLAKELRESIACNGNDLYSALQELYTFGTTSAKCIPYNTLNDSSAKIKYDLGVSSDPNNIPNCWDAMTQTFDTCVDNATAARIYRADDIYSLTPSQFDIMQEIYRWGPVSAGFKVYDSFMEYDGKSIYMGPKKDKDGRVIDNVAGGHAIRIVGWGEEDGINFWWIANSWSDKWGINGYFRMKRMIPECQLEQNVVGVKPDFPGPSRWTITGDLVEDINKRLRGLPGHHVDPNILYYLSAVDKVRNGTLKGDLHPIIEQRDIPGGNNFADFWVADLIPPESTISFIGINMVSILKFIIFLLLVSIGTILILKSSIH